MIIWPKITIFFKKSLTKIIENSLLPGCFKNFWKRECDYVIVLQSHCSVFQDGSVSCGKAHGGRKGEKTGIFWEEADREADRSQLEHHLYQSWIHNRSQTFFIILWNLLQKQEGKLRLNLCRYVCIIGLLLLNFFSPVFQSEFVVPIHQDFGDVFCKFLFSISSTIFTL